MMRALAEARPVTDRRPALPNRIQPSPFGPGKRDLAVLVRRDEQADDHSVQLPLLAPMLAGLRLRYGVRGSDFVLPNPSGGRGVYVTSWSVVTGFATPSPHDTMLIGRLSCQSRIDPRTVRDAARQVARDGHAGEAAADAARDVDAALGTAAIRLGAQLLMNLARRAGFAASEQAADCLSRGGFNRLAGRLGWHGPDLAEALRLLSTQYATVALNASPDGVAWLPTGWGEPFSSRRGWGRWGRLVALVRRLRKALAEEQSAGHGSDGATIGRIIASADLCLTRADRLLPRIEAMLANPMPLLERWRDGSPDDAALGELEAAFDGWARVCLLWFDPDTQNRRQAVIAEMAILTRSVGNSENRLQVDVLSEPASHLNLLLERNKRLRVREFLLDAGDA